MYHLGCFGGHGHFLPVATEEISEARGQEHGQHEQPEHDHRGHHERFGHHLDLHFTAGHEADGGPEGCMFGATGGEMTVSMSWGRVSLGRGVHRVTSVKISCREWCTGPKLWMGPREVASRRTSLATSTESAWNRTCPSSALVIVTPVIE